jgi:pre-mRNA-splicing factor ATP-dependent RNA helicase DHX38/PRP16
VKQALAIHINQPPGDILIFMTGQEDIESTCILIAENIAKLKEGVPPL